MRKGFLLGQSPKKDEEHAQVPVVDQSTTVGVNYTGLLSPADEGVSDDMQEEEEGGL